MQRFFRFMVALLVVASGWGLRADDWPAWRGPHGDGSTTETGFPLEWSAETHVRWKVALPGPGNSTPIVCGDRVLVSCASDEGRRRSLLCFAAADGKQLWERSVEFPEVERTHNTNPQCSSSPVTDGQRVIVWHGSAGVHAYDLDGQPLWQADLGTFEHIWGTGSSPLLYEDLVILNCGPGVRTFVVALDKRTGKEVWRREPEGIVSKTADEYHGSWSTPVLVRSQERPLLLLSLPTRLWAWDPLTGNDIWSAGGLGKLVYTSPLVTDELVVSMSGYHGPAMAVRRGGEGDVTESHRAWYHERGQEAIPQRVGTGLIVGGHLYILNEPGICWCLDVATGERKWEQRLEQGQTWSSMNYADGRLYALTMKGDTYVLAADPTECRVLARNPIGEMTRASLAFSAGRIYQRTYQHLYCFGSPDP
ncbi:MAG: PQQ-binding-like beta-propeller repeat protein [Pirellulaceae bacterium]|nr:PQQ-binding-like beta-propeller repeat protein [Pirellulaceae bacterium]